MTRDVCEPPITERSEDSKGTKSVEGKGPFFSNSFPLNLCLRCNDGPAHVFLDHLWSLLPSKVKRRNTKLKHVGLDCLIANLYHGWKHKRSLGISRDRNHYTRLRFEKPSFYTYDTFKTVTDFFKELDLVRLTLGSERRRSCSRLHPKPKLHSEFNTWSCTERSPIKHVPINQPLIVLRNSIREGGKGLPVPSTRQVERMRKRLEDYNSLMSSTTIDLDCEAICKRDRLSYRGYDFFHQCEEGERGGIYITQMINFLRVKYGQDSKKIDEFLVAEKHLRFLHNHHLRRIFNNRTFSQGGRHYTMGPSYQTFTKVFRSGLLINGKPTVELDYESMQPTMLYHQRGLTPPSNPYLFECNNPMRDIFKIMLLVALNASTYKEVIAGMVSKLTYNNTRGNQEHLCRTFQNSRYWKGNFGVSLKLLYKDILEHHMPILDQFNTGAGLRLQRQDSDIASNILEHFCKSNIPVLCVHDSFIIEDTYKEELKRVMQVTYSKKMNATINVR